MVSFFLHLPHQLAPWYSYFDSYFDYYYYHLQAVATFGGWHRSLIESGLVTSSDSPQRQAAHLAPSFALVTFVAGASQRSDEIR